MERGGVESGRKGRGEKGERRVSAGFSMHKYIHILSTWKHNKYVCQHVRAVLQADTVSHSLTH